MNKHTNDIDDDDYDEGTEYSDMELLERLETLREDMEELGIISLDELIARITSLHKKLDED